MGQLKVTGDIAATPLMSGGSEFPAGVTEIPLSCTPNPKGWVVKSHDVKRLNSPGAYVDLSGIGSTDNVTRGDFLFLKTDNRVQFRLTQGDGAGGQVQAVINVQGLLLMEFPPNRELLDLEAQGTATIEYLVTGQS